ncbi:MAG: alpha/beta fold hydrolase [Rhizobiaceae bacterium]|nr:alpha/beta fold hydrolase [Rhizobiaceae bacterium]
MLRRTLLALAAATALVAALPATHAEETAMNAETKPTLVKSGHVAANGLSYYYEIHGQGEPLLLLHGGLGSIDMFGPVLPALAAGRKVIAVDLHGHGRTALGDRSINLPDIGDDLAVVLDGLGERKVDVLGYSFGGGAAFRLAVQHPDRVRRLALVSAGFAANGFYAEMRPQQAQVSGAAAEFMRDTPMYRSYMAVAPNPEEFPKLLDNMGAMMRKDYDWSEDAKKLAMPVMIVFGDSDMYRPEHIVEFYQLLGGGLRDAGWNRETMAKNRLAIIPNRTHYDIFFSQPLVEAVLPFLNGEDKPKDWNDVVKGG